MSKQWVPIDEARRRLRGNLGVFQLADETGEVIYIGYAGGSSTYGLRGEVDAALADIAATSVRWEVNTQYLSRFRELMMVHIADHGVPPSKNPPVRLGKLSPS
jgi:hypothetical protein